MPPSLARAQTWAMEHNEPAISSVSSPGQFDITLGTGPRWGGRGAGDSLAGTPDGVAPPPQSAARCRAVPRAIAKVRRNAAPLAEHAPPLHGPFP